MTHINVYIFYYYYYFCRHLKSMGMYGGTHSWRDVSRGRVANRARARRLCALFRSGSILASVWFWHKVEVSPCLINIPVASVSHIFCRFYNTAQMTKRRICYPFSVCFVSRWLYSYCMRGAASATRPLTFLMSGLYRNNFYLPIHLAARLNFVVFLFSQDYNKLKRTKIIYI